MPSLQLRPRSGPETCPLCMDRLDSASVQTCEECQTSFHVDCGVELSTGCPTAGCQGRGEPARVASQEAIRPLGSPEFKLALLGIAFVAVGAGVLLTALWFLLDALLDF